MSATPNIYKPKALSGYPEWLPEVRRVEQQWLDRIRKVFESYGFCSIETPVVEELAVLSAKGETADKEIYAVQRLNADDSDQSESRLGLHYDLTVPMARYVAQHFGDLVFPFKRYQMQKVWRGERPQEGRYREFYQCDIDVVNPDEVPLQYDAEMPAIIWEVLQELQVGECTIFISNRKILDGFLSGLGMSETAPAIRALDKLDKIGPVNTATVLRDTVGLAQDAVDKCMRIASIRTPDTSFLEQVCALGVQSEMLELGLTELEFVFNELQHLPKGSLIADLSIARGFDYYTGSIYEAKLKEFPQLGSIVAGGRYDDLASSYINRRLPGVGISIGLTRIFAKLLIEGRIPLERKCPTDILVCWMIREQRAKVLQTAASLRARGYNVETFHEPDKLKKQIRYADRKVIPYVWFAPEHEGAQHEVKDMKSGEQVAADPLHWKPNA